MNHSDIGMPAVGAERKAARGPQATAGGSLRMPGGMLPSLQA
jgi:hypothetical protein